MIKDAINKYFPGCTLFFFDNYVLNPKSTFTYKVSTFFLKFLSCFEIYPCDDPNQRPWSIQLKNVYQSRAQGSTRFDTSSHFRATQSAFKNQSV